MAERHTERATPTTTLRLVVGRYHHLPFSSELRAAEPATMTLRLVTSVTSRHEKTSSATMMTCQHIIVRSS